MTESFHESPAHERDRSLDGLIEVAYNDDHSIVLDVAEVFSTQIRREEVNIPYDVLVMRDNYVLEPYTVYDREKISRFGDQLEAFELPDGKTGLQSKKRAIDLGFISLVQTINYDDIDILNQKSSERQKKDAINFTMLHRELKDQRYDLWLRLQHKQLARGFSAEPIVARLEYIGYRGEQLLMVPHIKNTNGHQVDYIPEQLTLGDPWLYVGIDYRPEPEED